MDIQQTLRELADPKYKAFHAKLIPNVPPEKILGVRKPQVSALARQIEKTPEAEAFLAALPHAFYDENALHGALICRMRAFDAAMAATEPTAMPASTASQAHRPSFSAQSAQFLLN